MEEHPSSRSLEDAHPDLVRRWLWMLGEYQKRYPDDPLPQVSHTYRNKADQDKAFTEGHSKVKYPDSCHNSLPSLALDYFFWVDGKTAYPEEWMQRVMALSQEAGLFSGGLSWGWDKPHIALCEKPSDWPKVLLPPLPGDEVSRRLENSPKFVFNAPEPIVFEGGPGQTLLIRVSEGRVDARFDGDLEQKVDETFQKHFPSLTKGDKMQPTDTARIAKLNGMANKAEQTRPFSLDETFPIQKYVTIGGNVVALLLSTAAALGIANFADLDINALIATISSSIITIYTAVMSIAGALAQRQTWSQKTVAEDLHDMRASTKR